MLYIWMPEGDAAWRWRLNARDEWQLAANWEALLQDSQLAMAGMNATGRTQKQAIVFFPTSSVQMLRQPLSRQQLRQLGASGIRYLLEEFTLIPVDQLAVYYQMDDDAHVNIMAMPQGLIQQYLQVLALGGWTVQALLPDFLLIPAPGQASHASLLIHQQQRILRTGSLMAYSADDLAILLEYLPDLSQLDVWGNTTLHDQMALERVAGLASHQHDWAATAPVLTDAQYSRHAFNVVPKARSQLTGYWRAVAAVFVAGLMVQMLYDGMRIWRYNQIAEHTHAMAVQQYQRWFPQERRIVNLKNQFAGHLQTTQSTNVNALILLSRVGPTLQQASLTASQVQYRDDTLELTLLASGLPALENVRAQLSSQGLQAQLGSVNPVNGQVSGLIRVQL